MPNIRLIALDLDGTLLNSQKELTEINAQALAKAAARGIHIVPTTGRFFQGMPEQIRNLPYLRYAITINGAQVYDIEKNIAVAKAEIPLKRALEIMSYLDTLPVIYDCYMDNWGWMTRSQWERAEEFAPNVHYAHMLRELRKPVDEVKAFIAQHGHDVQKIQFFMKEPELKARLLTELPSLWPDIAVTTSVENNIELNQMAANKGNALRQLAEYLKLPIEKTMAFGDGLNDMTMLREAGLGIAMANSCPEVLAVADAVTADCDHDGVAQAIEQYCEV